MSNMFFHFQYAPSFICLSATRRLSTEKTQKRIASNHKMPMSTNSENYCAYNKIAHIEQAIILPLR